MYAMSNPTPTASSDKYPQGKFKSKQCRECGSLFAPQAPSQFYCCKWCSDRGLTSAYLKRNYGITLQDYELMLEDQDCLCAICGGEGFIMDTTRHKIKLVVDHDHKTGMVRGLLCHNCNRALGLLKDSSEILQTAIDYLEGATTIPYGSRAKRLEAPSPS